MDATVLLKDDHKTVEKLFKQLGKGRETALAAAEPNAPSDPMTLARAKA